MVIALHRGKGLVARLIKWQTRSQYSHASAVLSDGRVVEAREGVGVQVLPGMPVTEDVDYFEIDGLTWDQERTAEEFLLEQEGKGYDYTMIARFLTRRQEARSSTGKWFCSELVFAALRKAGMVLLARMEPWRVAPGHLEMSPRLLL